MRRGAAGGAPEQQPLGAFQAQIVSWFRLLSIA
jgi:hypothetical protein